MPDQADPAAAQDPLGAHAETGWRLGRACLERLEAGEEPDPGALDAAVGHLEIAVIDGVDGIVISDPDLMWLLGRLLLGAADQATADPAGRAVTLDAAEEAHVVLAAAADESPAADPERLALLDGILLACRYRTGALEPGVDAYHPGLELTRARDLQVTAAQDLARAVPPGADGADYAAAELIRALAARLLGRTGAADDATRLIEALWSRPDLRAAEGPAEAAGLVLLTGYALGRAFEHAGREELLLPVADLVAEARSWPDVPAPVTPQLALMLASVIVNGPEDGSLASRLGEVTPLLDESAAGMAADDPQRPQVDLHRAMLLQRLASRDLDPAGLTAAAQEISRTARLPQVDTATLSGLLGGVLEARFRSRLDLRDVRSGLELSERALAGLTGTPLQRAGLLANRGIQLMQLAWMAGDRSGVTAALESVREAIEIAPAGSPLAGQLHALVAAGLMTHAQDLPAPRQAEVLAAAWAEASRGAELNPTWPQTLVIQMVLAQVLGPADPLIRAAGEQAARRLDEVRARLATHGQRTGLIDMAALMIDGFAAVGPTGSAELLEAAISRMDALPGDPRQPPIARHLLGMQQARLLRRRDDLSWKRSLETYLETPAARELPAGQLGRWLAQGPRDTSDIGDHVAHGLGERIRDSPDRRRSRQIGLEVLRGHVERVLLQSGTADALATARAASGDSHEVVSWCAADGADDEAIAALETGRGLTLLAGVVAGSVHERLMAMGELELARSWQESQAGALSSAGGGEPVPDDVRHRVLDRLTASGDLVGLLQPPDRQGLAAALTDLGYDALVYLIPQGRSPAGQAGAGQPLGGFAGRPGGALLVTAAGQVRWQDLPELAVGPDTVIGAYLRAQLGLLAPGAAPDQRDAWREALEQACQWAWTAAMEPLAPLLQHIHPTRRARVVLVPVDALCVIPWHAAYPPADHRLPPAERRYAMDSATFSYSASGGLLARIARRPSPSLSASALLIGDPGGDLPYAQAEIQALRDAFYPEAVTWGEPTELTAGPATPARLRAALRDGGHALVHYAGHATIDAARPGSSALVLGGEQRLRADSISALAPARSYCVCLAACTTHLTADAFDEVFTLSTAFLLGGASTVVGSLWRIKDAGAAALMFMLHYYLSRGQRPADALHRAQSWMLRPSRAIPASMPPSIRDALPRLDLTDPILWAGLAHQGR